MDSIIMIYAAFNLVYTIWVYLQMNNLHLKVKRLKKELALKELLTSTIILKQNATILDGIEE